jgi:hypothetical protein
MFNAVAIPTLDPFVVVVVVIVVNYVCSTYTTERYYSFPSLFILLTYSDGMVLEMNDILDVNKDSLSSFLFLALCSLDLKEEDI